MSDSDDDGVLSENSDEYSDQCSDVSNESNADEFDDGVNGTLPFIFGDNVEWTYKKGRRPVSIGVNDVNELLGERAIAEITRH